MPDIKRSEAQLVAAMGRVDTRMRLALEAADPGFGPALAAMNVGKKLRVRLTLLAAQAAGRIQPRVERLAAAMEFFHYATLIHDDVIDNARQRRHRPTLNARFGNETAVMLGDLMLTQVMHLLIRDMPPTVQQIAARTASLVCQGELKEIMARGDLRLDARTYEQIISQKTACLFSACTEGGGLLAGANPQHARWLKRFGWSLGMAFQIRDDLLDLFGDRRQVGKAVGADLKEGRITLPVILGLNRLKGSRRKALAAAVNSGQDVGAIRRELQACGAAAAAEARGRVFARQAEQAALQLPGSPARDTMIRLAQFALERNA